MRVLVTGASGCLGRVLIPALCADASIEQVTGIDRRPADYAHAKFRPVQLDITQDLTPHLFRGHQALVHMAWIVLRGRMPVARMHATNVVASMEVLRLAAASGVRRLIALSSAAVYGAGVDVTEDATLTPVPGFSYGEHKAELEGRVAIELPHCLRLRPHMILGPNAQPLLRFLLRQPYYPQQGDAEPMIQCVHESDVAHAILLALHSTAGGPLNLAAPQSFSYAEAIRRRHPNARSVPFRVAQAALTTSWSLTGFGGEPRWMAGLRLPLTLDCARARASLGWAPRISAYDALNAT